MFCFKHPSTRIMLCWNSFLRVLNVVGTRERAFYVFLAPTKKARKGCQARSALYHEYPDYRSMFLDQVYEGLKRLTKPPVFMYVPNFKKPKKDVMRNENFSPKSRIKTETTLEIKSYNIVTKTCTCIQLIL